MSYKTLLAPNLEKHLGYEELLAEKLVFNVGDHKNGPDGFQPYPYDKDYEPHSIQCIGLEGHNATQLELEKAAESFFPDTHDKIFEILRKNPEIVHKSFDTIISNGSIALATDHSSVLGLPVVGGMFMHAFYEQELFEPNDIEVVLIANGMIKHTKMHGIFPTADVAAGLVSKIAWTLPSSTSIQEAEIDKEVRDDFNEESINEIDKAIEDEKPAIFLFAASGQRDVITKRRFGQEWRQPAIMHMRPPAYGTTDLLKKMHSIGIGIDIRKKPSLYTTEINNPVKNEDDVHRIMELIARGISKQTRPERRYHKTRESFYEATKDMN